jgi:predicted MPP superfamily phosphohydrolase
LTEEYEFLFIADNHSIVIGNDDDKRCLDNALPRMGVFKNSVTGTSAADEFKQWIDYANKTKVDGLLLGGDMIDFPSNGNIELLRNNLSRLNMPYLYTLGNHDWTYPWEYFSETSETVYKPIFDEFTNGNTVVQTMEYDDFIIVSVDNSKDQMNPLIFGGLEEALAKEKPTIIMMHVPLETPSIYEKSTEMWGRDIAIGINGVYPNSDSAKFTNMICDKDSPVVAILAGHVHFSDTSKITDKITQYVTNVAYEGYGILFTVKGS